MYTRIFWENTEIINFKKLIIALNVREILTLIATHMNMHEVIISYIGKFD